jgi:hypothetical protein
MKYKAKPTFLLAAINKRTFEASQFHLIDLGRAIQGAI